MIKFKDGVPLSGLQPDMLYCIDTCNDVFKQFGHDLIVTSTTDGTHMLNSKHYVGYAIDLRIWHLEGLESIIRVELEDALGTNYDVVLESDHIHVEFDPN